MSIAFQLGKPSNLLGASFAGMACSAFVGRGHSQMIRTLNIFELDTPWYRSLRVTGSLSIYVILFAQPANSLLHVQRDQMNFCFRKTCSPYNTHAPNQEPSITEGTRITKHCRPSAKAFVVWDRRYTTDTVY